MTTRLLPNRPLRLIVGASAGSAAAIVARALAPALASELRQPVNIEFHQGENNELGPLLVAGSSPDGCTLLMTTLGVLALLPSLNPPPPYHAASELVPVALAARCPLVLAVHPAVPARSVDELTRLAREQPGKLTFATSGIGGAPHIAAELYMKMAGVDMSHVCYHSTQQLFTDLVEGRLSLSFNNIMPMLEPLSNGKLRGLAVTSAARLPSLPHLPTLAESGLAGYEITNWLGIVAPAGVSPEIIAALNAAIVGALQSDDVQRNLAASGMEIAGGSPAEFARYIRSEFERWAPIVRGCSVRNAVHV